MRYIITALLILTMTASCGGRGTGTRGTSKSAAADNAAPADGANSETANNANAPERKPRPWMPFRYTYKLVKTFPHDTEAYTQGLFWHDGYLYEGTGQYGESELRKVDLQSGKVVQKISLARKYFGEGIVLLDGKIYQLTWLAGSAMVYDADTFRHIKSFLYDGEGWGITTDGKKLYMSNGTDEITVRDPDTFDIERTIRVTNGRNRVRNINELEWIDGEIWANLYTTEQVARIDPESGIVVGIIDFSGIQAPHEITPQDDYFNGIAYDPATGNIYVTGKKWSKLYQVEVIEKR